MKNGNHSKISCMKYRNYSDISCITGSGAGYPKSNSLLEFHPNPFWLKRHPFWMPPWLTVGKNKPSTRISQKNTNLLFWNTRPNSERTHVLVFNIPFQGKILSIPFTVTHLQMNLAFLWFPLVLTCPTEHVTFSFSLITLRFWDVYCVVPSWPILVFYALSLCFILRSVFVQTQSRPEGTRPPQPWAIFAFLRTL